MSWQHFRAELGSDPLITLSTVKLSFVLPGLLLVAGAAVSPPVESGSASSDAVIQLAAVDEGDFESSALATADDLDSLDSYRLSLFKLKGHLGVARTLLQVRAPGADYHLQQPMQEIFQQIEPELDERGAPLSADTLKQLESATETTPQAALATIDLAAAAIDGSFAQAGAPDAQSAFALAEILLRESVHLYAESVIDNEVVDVRKYQTGRGFVIQAEALVRHSSGLRGRPGQDELIAAVVLIRQAWPGVSPPPIVFAPEDVAGRLEDAVATMEKIR